MELLTSPARRSSAVRVASAARWLVTNPSLLPMILTSRRRLAHQEVHHGGFPAAVLFHLLRVSGDHFLDYFLQRPSVRNLLQAFALRNLGRRLAGRKHLGKNFLGQLARKLTARDQRS